MSETAFYLSVGDSTVFATRHSPERPSGRQAVIIVPPFGWEAMVTHRSRREWALHLCEQGHDVLRFDLPGTGDSSGTLADEGLWDTWQTVTTELARWLRAATGGGRIAAIGLALGGYLAHEAAAQGAVDDLVEWATPTRGKRYLRELSAFAAMEAARDSDDAALAVDVEPGIAAGGYLLPAAMAEALSALDLAATPLPGGVRTLLVRRDGIGGDDRLLDVLRSAGNEVDADPGQGYGLMVTDSDKSRAPTETFLAVDRWLAAAPRGTGAAASAARVVESGELTLGDLSEEPIAVTRPAGVLRGVIARPRSSAAGAAPFTLVFLNPGAVPRWGLNRLWVRFARSAALSGIPSVRLDLYGIGEADGDALRYHRVSEFYVDWLVDETRAALESLRNTDLPRRQMLVGLCAGGFWAFHALLGDADVVSAVLINPRILYWHDDIDALRALRQARQMVRSITVGRALRGVVSPRHWIKFVIGVSLSVARALRPGAHAGESMLRWHAAQVDRGLERLAESGKSVHFMFCDDEPLRDELLGYGVLDEQVRRVGVSLTLLPGRVHTLTPIRLQDAVAREFQEVVAADADRAPVQSVGDER